MLRLNNLLKQKGVTTLYFMHTGGDNDKYASTMEEIMDGVMEFSLEGAGAKFNRYIKIKKMKPEFAILPQVFHIS